jgi:hypothetical protein
MCSRPICLFWVFSHFFARLMFSRTISLFFDLALILFHSRHVDVSCLIFSRTSRPSSSFLVLAFSQFSQALRFL